MRYPSPFSRTDFGDAELSHCIPPFNHTVLIVVFPVRRKGMPCHDPCFFPHSNIRLGNTYSLFFILYFPFLFLNLMPGLAWAYSFCTEEHSVFYIRLSLFFVMWHSARSSRGHGDTIIAFFSQCQERSRALSKTPEKHVIVCGHCWVESDRSTMWRARIMGCSRLG